MQTESAAIRVVVVDDHPLSIQAISAVLTRAGYDVVGVAADAASGTLLIERCRPRVAVVDLKLPDADGAEVVREAMRFPEVRTLVFTGSLEAADLEEALATGAAGIASKVSPVEQLVDGVAIVAAGNFYLDERVKAAILAAKPTGPVLTRREREVLSLVAQGENIEPIADLLFLSHETVRTHLANARRKLGARNRTEAVVAAKRTSQIRMPEAG